MDGWTETEGQAWCEQVYLIERDAGLLCRILGLYAAQAMDLLHVEYAYAASAVMRLDVRVGTGAPTDTRVAEAVRVLVAKAQTWVGVLAAVEHAGSRHNAIGTAPHRALEGARPCRGT